MFYIQKLDIPEGLEIEILPVEGASSMTAGYNFAMNQTNAKYKVYLHQDLFLIREDFLYMLMDLFSDNEVGMVGLLGSTRFIEDATYAQKWWQ